MKAAQKSETSIHTKDEYGQHVFKMKGRQDLEAYRRHFRKYPLTGSFVSMNRMIRKNIMSNIVLTNHN